MFRSFAAIGAFAAFLAVTTPTAFAQDRAERLPSPATVKALTVPYYALEFIAADEGIFKAYNLDVQFVTQVAQGAAGIPAIVSEQVQTAQGYGVNAILQARAGGAKVTAVYAGITSTYGDFRFYTLEESGIKTAKDMAGKSFGINNLGTYADIALQVFLTDAGMKIEQVRRTTVPLPSMCQALLSKQIDIVAMYSGFYVPCEKLNPGKLHVLAKDSDAILPARSLYSAYVFSDDYIKANPAVVRAYVAALREAAAMVEKDPARTTAIISKRMGVAPDMLLVPTFAKGGCIDMKAASDWTALMVKYNAIKPGSVEGASWATNALNSACKG